MIELTEDKAVELLRAAVEARGADYVYPRDQRGDKCVYVYGDKPDCIVGEVLYRAGVTVAAISSLGDHHAGDEFHDEIVVAADQLIKALREAEVLQASPQATDLLARVQTFQDTGSPWGDAVRLAQLD